MKRLALLPLLLLASAARADVMPISSNEDPRIGIVHTENGGAIHLQATAGIDLTILLPRGERVTQVTVGDTNVWHAAVPEGRDAVVLSALRASGPTSMSIQTSRKAYAFVLTGVMAGSPFYMVRLDGTNSVANRPRVWTPPVVVQPGTYKLSGKKEIFPSSIRDDGRKIYLQWPTSQPIPAVFALDRLGHEEMVDGYMREDIFTLDRLYDELVFRIDKAEAHAKRIVGKGKP
jgi:type IV secretion system protein VirB9